MTADSWQSLHDFAGRLALPHIWFRTEPYPHYSIPANKREIALHLDAMDRATPAPAGATGANH